MFKDANLSIQKKTEILFKKRRTFRKKDEKTK